MESLPFFVAEVSANHNGNLAKAKKLIYTAKKNGADAVKIQSYSPSTMTQMFICVCSILLKKCLFHKVKLILVII